MTSTVMVLGTTGEFIGFYIARECLKRPNTITKILVRAGYETDTRKKSQVDELVASGAQLILGDAYDAQTVNEAFQGVDVVISSLGGWGPLNLAHANVYESCRLNNVKRVIPAQFGFDVLSMDPTKMDNYMFVKRGWNQGAIDSGIPYTIVSQGAFYEWMLLFPQHPCIHHDTRTVDYTGSDYAPGWVCSSMEDSARLTVQAAFDPNMANRRISIAGSRVSPRDIARELTRVTGHTYTTHYIPEETFVIDPANSYFDNFSAYIHKNLAACAFYAGFEPPILLDTQSIYGWTPETFSQACDRLLGHKATEATTAAAAAVQDNQV